MISNPSAVLTYPGLSIPDTLIVPDLNSLSHPPGVSEHAENEIVYPLIVSEVGPPKKSVPVKVIPAVGRIISLGKVIFTVQA